MRSPFKLDESCLDGAPARNLKPHAQLPGSARRCDEPCPMCRVIVTCTNQASLRGMKYALVLVQLRRNEAPLLPLAPTLSFFDTSCSSRELTT
jgi:hypothetical protein